jgi:hypothetical protein
MKKMIISVILVAGIAAILQSQSTSTSSKAMGKDVYASYCLT